MQCTNSSTCPGAAVCYLNHDAPGQCHCLSQWAYAGPFCLQPTIFTQIQIAFAFVGVMIGLGFLLAGVSRIWFAITRHDVTTIRNVHGFILCATLSSLISVVAALCTDMIGSFTYPTRFGNSNTKPIMTTWIDTIYVETMLSVVGSHGNLMAIMAITSIWARIALDARRLTPHSSHVSVTRGIRLGMFTAMLSITACTSTWVTYVMSGIHACFITVVVFVAITMLLFLTSAILLTQTVHSNGVSGGRASSQSNFLNTRTGDDDDDSSSIFRPIRQRRRQSKDLLLILVLRRIRLTCYVVCVGQILVMIGAGLFQRVNDVPGYDAQQQNVLLRPTVASYYVMNFGQLVTSGTFIVYTMINLKACCLIRVDDQRRDVERITIRLSSKISKELPSKGSTSKLSKVDG